MSSRLWKTIVVPAFTVSSFGVKAKLSMFTSMSAARTGHVETVRAATINNARQRRQTLERCLLVKLRMLVSFC
jgi:hypothetical protein